MGSSQLQFFEPRRARKERRLCIRSGQRHVPEETDTDYDPATGMVSAELAAGEGRLYVLPKGF